MKIDAMSGYRSFGKTNPSTAAKAPQASERAAKTDVVDFSRGQTAPPDKTMTTLRSGILRDASRPAGAEELAALKESIREGSYHRSTDELVDAILGKI